MDCSYQEFGLDDLSLLFEILVFLVLRRITLYFGDNVKGKKLLLIVYVDDIIVTGDDVSRNADLKCYLQKHLLDTLDLCDTFYALKWLDPRRKLLFPEKICA